MIFGDWLAILFGEARKASHRVHRGLRTEGTEKTRRRSGEVGDFFVEVGEGGFQGFAVVGVRGGVEVVRDADARELQLLDILLAALLLIAFCVAPG
jgi:hypothetical protein